jgi:hypothetical protein
MEKNRGWRGYDEQKQTPPGCKPYGLEAKETKIVDRQKETLVLPYLLFKVLLEARLMNTKKR